MQGCLLAADALTEQKGYAAAGQVQGGMRCAPTALLPSNHIIRSWARPAALPPAPRACGLRLPRPCQAFFLHDDHPGVTSQVNQFEFLRPLVEGLGFKHPTAAVPASAALCAAWLLEWLHWLLWPVCDISRWFILTRTEVRCWAQPACFEWQAGEQPPSVVAPPPRAPLLPAVARC